MKTLKVGMLQEIQNWGLINSNSKPFTSTFGALDLSRKGLWISQRKETLIEKQTNKQKSLFRCDNLEIRNSCSTSIEF